jgi:hypothetical protein
MDVQWRLYGIDRQVANVLNGFVTTGCGILISMKHVLILTFSVILLLSMVSPLTAQDRTAGTVTVQAQESVFKTWPSSLGYYFGLITGNGLSWQRWFGKTSLSVSAGGLYDPDMSSWDNFLDYSIQLQVSRMLHAFARGSWMAGNLQAVLMVGHRGTIAWEWMEPDAPLEEDSDRSYPDPEYRQGPFQPALFIGLGVAVETVLFRHIAQTHDLMYIFNPLEMTVDISVGSAIRFRY